MPEQKWVHDDLKTLPQILRSAAERWPDRVGHELGGAEITYAELARDVVRTAHGLRALGVAKGDAVCTMLDTSFDAMRILYALTSLGAIAVPINTSYKGEFLRHQIVNAGATLLIAESDYAARMIAIAGELPEVRTLLHRGPAPDAPTNWELQPLDVVHTDCDDDLGVEVKPTDLALLLYTSGTTGAAKGCMIPHGYICNAGLQVVFGTQLTEKDVLWTPLPLFHLNAISMAMVAAPSVGARVSFYPRFSLSNFWPEIERTGATVASILGSMIALIANAPDNDAMKRAFGQIRVAIGAPFTRELTDIWKKRFGVRHAGSPGYGMTEMVMITLAPLHEGLPPGISGRRFADYDVRILNDDGDECPPGVPGEIVARPTRPGIMFDGYWRQPEATVKVWKGLWFHTGDIGKIDAEGRFAFVDRKKDYLRRGGENISSFEMETAFRAHPMIEDVAVHAVPSDLLEDEVKVTAILKPGASLGEEELCRWSLDQLPYFAVPRYIEFRAELPRNPVGRVLKYELRAEGVTENTWDRARSGIQIQKR